MFLALQVLITIILAYVAYTLLEWKGLGIPYCRLCTVLLVTAISLYLTTHPTPTIAFLLLGAFAFDFSGKLGKKIKLKTQEKMSEEEKQKDERPIEEWTTYAIFLLITIILGVINNG